MEWLVIFSPVTLVSAAVPRWDVFKVPDSVHFLRNKTGFTFILKTPVIDVLCPATSGYFLQLHFHRQFGLFSSKSISVRGSILS